MEVDFGYLYLLKYQCNSGKIIFNIEIIFFIEKFKLFEKGIKSKVASQKGLKKTQFMSDEIIEVTLNHKIARKGVSRYSNKLY